MNTRIMVSVLMMGSVLGAGVAQAQQVILRDQQVHQDDGIEITMTVPSEVGAQNQALPPAVRAYPSGGAGPRLLGTDVTQDNLLEISTMTGNGAVIGTVGDGVIGGLAYDPNNQILYGSSLGDDMLVKIDPGSGSIIAIGPLGVILMHGLGYDSNNDELYGVTNQSGTRAFYSIDVSTGAATLISTHGLWGLSGLAFDPGNNVMYASGIFPHTLYVIDPDTGALTSVGPFLAGTRLGVGLAFDAAVGLYASDNHGTIGVDDELYLINPSTGQATLVGPINHGNVLGLSFVALPGQTMPMDIKPGSCPNPLNPASWGVLPVALLGTIEFDVSNVDISTLLIIRADGVGESAAPNEGPPGPHTVIEDVGTPFDGELCDCQELIGDGINDVSLKFKTQDVVAALLLDLEPSGSQIELCVSGNTLDGGSFLACDCIHIVNK